MTVATILLLFQLPALTASANSFHKPANAQHASAPAASPTAPVPAGLAQLSPSPSALALNFAQPPTVASAFPPAAKPVEIPAPITYKPVFQPSESLNTLTGPPLSESFLPPPANFRPPYELPVTHRGWWMALSTAEHSAAGYDAWSTRYALSNGRVEADPVMRPFAGSSAIYPAIQVIPFGLDYLAHRLQRSSGWTHRIWWVPQSAATVTFLFSGSYNLAHTN